MLGADLSAVANSSSMVADPLCKRSRMIFSSRSSVFTDIPVCRSHSKVQLHLPWRPARMGTSSSHYGLWNSVREKFAQVPVRPPVIIEIDSGMMRDVREDHYPGDERNLHGHVRCRVEASGSARHVARTREDAAHCQKRWAKPTTRNCTCGANFC